jgi:glycerol uptake facilitator-like aquaporin
MNGEISTACLAFDQILGTALLVIIILAVTDANNMKPNSGLVPLLIGLGLCAIHISFGLNAGAAINPARDLAPRILSILAGWPADTFKVRDYWFWIPTILPFIGGPLGALTYYGMIEMHHDDADKM